MQNSTPGATLVTLQALSQTVALRMSHAGEMEELQQVMEEKVGAREEGVGLVLDSGRGAAASQSGGGGWKEQEGVVGATAGHGGEVGWSQRKG